MLVEHLQHRDINAFRDAVSHGDVATVTRLLGLPHVKEQVDAPMFAFGQRAAHIAAKRPPMLEALIAAGANLNLMSEWEIGPYTVLDNATEETARLLLAGGVRLTPNVAARLGWIDELRQLLVANSHLVHARGGDGSVVAFSNAAPLPTYSSRLASAMLRWRHRCSMSIPRRSPHGSTSPAMHR